MKLEDFLREEGPETIRMLIEFGEDTVANVLGLTRKNIEEKMKYYQRKLDFFKDSWDGSVDADEVRPLFKTLFSLNSYLRTSSKELRDFTDYPEALDEFLNYEQAEEVIYEMLDCDTEGIETVFTGSNIFVRLPLLAHRRYGSETKNYFYGKAVRRSMEYSKTRKNYDSRKFPCYEIFYLFVYATDKGMRDADNFYTSDVTNAIASVLPFGDTAPYCEFRFKSMRVDGINEGTYVTVSPSTSRISAEEVINFWIEKQTQMPF